MDSKWNKNSSIFAVFRYKLGCKTKLKLGARIADTGLAYLHSLVSKLRWKRSLYHKSEVGTVGTEEHFDVNQGDI